MIAFVLIDNVPVRANVKRLRKIWIDALDAEYSQHLSDLTPFMD